MNPQGSALEVQKQNIMTGEESRAYAKELSESKIISQYFRGSIPNVLYAMELGRVYGLAAATVLQNIHVFPDSKGNLKAATSAHLMVTLARRAGHIVNTTSNPKGATCTIIRGDSIFGKMLKGNVDPGELAHYSAILSTLKDLDIDAKEMGVSQVRWTTEMAIRAELMGKDNWNKYPHSMFASAAKRDGVRVSCEEVLIQLADRSEQVMSEFGPLLADGQPIEVAWSYTADELGASITDDGEEVHLSPRSKVQERQEAPRESVGISRAVPSSTASAAADIAAQAAANPAQAGWHKESPAQSSPQEPDDQTIRNFVSSKAPSDIAVWARQTILSGLGDDVKSQRIVTVAKLLTECDIDKFAAVISAFSALEDLSPNQKLDLIGRLHQAAKDAGILKQEVDGGPSKLNDYIVKTVQPLMKTSSD